jgi:hypothetical protein
LSALRGGVASDRCCLAEALRGDYVAIDALGVQKLLNCLRALFRQTLVELGSTGAIGMTFDLHSQSRVRLQDSSDSRQAFARTGLQRVFAGVEQHIGHVDDEAAGGFAGLHYLIQLLQELLPSLFSLLLGALGCKLRLLCLSLGCLLLR